MPVEPVHKPWLKTLFSFRGRVGRLYFWGVNIALSAFLVAVLVVEGNDAETGPGGLFLLGYMLTIPVGLATTAKRWHDRNKSGWYVLIVLIPVIGGLWQFIECGLYPAVDIRNRFGAPGGGSPFS